MKYRAPKGTHDIVPGQIHRWQALEKEFRDLVTLYGYEEIRTPIFEDTEVFIRSSGDTSEVVSKQMYTFLDKKGRSLSLKPEETAPAIRAYLENQIGAQGQVTRLWYFAHIFRYEQPQAGRQRQHHQFGIELIGSSGAGADAEVINVAIDFYRRLGIDDLTVSLNSIGREKTRGDYRIALQEFVSSFIDGESEEVRERAKKNPLRLLDTKDPELLEKLSRAPKITDFLESQSREHLQQLCALLGEAGIRYEIDPSIVRGLDYYTDTVFEVKSNLLGAQSTLCGGGRYDNLVADLGGPPTPSVGFGLGIERTLLVLEKAGVAFGRPSPSAFVIAATEDARHHAREIARNLRAEGVSTMIDTDEKSLKAQFKMADRSRAKWAIIVGTEELAAKGAKLRNLESGEEVFVATESISERVK